MPHTINGIGTWYWGKRNRHVARMRCESCGYYGDLNSYDTTLYFVIVYIPVVPLGQKRILNECPKCRRHRVAKLSEWEAQKVKRIAELTEVVRQDPDNIAPVVEFVQTLVGYQDRQAFLTAVPALAQRFRNDADFQTLAGAGYANFGLLPEAEQQYRAAIATRGGDTSREWEVMAINLLKQGRPAESVSWLQPIFRDHLEGRAGLLALQVEGFQTVGQHREALAFIDLCTQEFPALATEKDFVKYRAVSTKHAASGNAIVSSALVPPKLPSREESRVGSWFRRLIGPAIGVGLLLIYFVASWSAGRHREVHVVNGIDRDYRVRIGGETVKVPRHARVAIRLPEGEIRIEPVDDSLKGTAQTIRLESPFWTRAFDQPVAVINPDRGAVLARETNYYAPSGSTPPGNQFELFSGSVSYEFPGIDFAFQPFPKTMQTKSSAPVSKVGLSLITGYGRAELATALRSARGPAMAAAFAGAQFEQDSSDTESLYIFSNLAEPRDALPVLRSGLAKRPLQIELHRVYQEVADRGDPHHDLEAEYAAYLQAAPMDASLAYLYARSIRDRAKAVAAYEQLLSQPDASPYVANAVAFEALVGGQFERAAELLPRVVSGPSDSGVFRYTVNFILMANARFEELLKRNEEAQQKEPRNLGLVLEAAQLRWKKGDLAGMKGEGERYLARLQSTTPKPEAKDLRDIRALLEGNEKYLQGDFAGAAAALAVVKMEPSALQADLMAGRYADAARRLRDPKINLPAYLESRQLHLLLYVLASRAGQRDFAEAELKLAIASLQTGSRYDRQAAAALGGDRSVPAADLVLLPLYPFEKVPILAALGTRYPDDKEKYFPLARKLNFDPAFPARLIEPVLGRP